MINRSKKLSEMVQKLAEANRLLIESVEMQEESIRLANEAMEIRKILDTPEVRTECNEIDSQFNSLV